MRFFTIIAVCACLFLGSAVLKAQASETVFFESLYDVPIMEGLSEIKELSTSFDKAQGRIGYASARSDDVSYEDVLSFYGKVLTQMGWRQVTPEGYMREQERLQISFEKTDTYGVIQFSLGPVKK